VQDGDHIIESVKHKPKKPKRKKMARKFYREDNEAIPAIKFALSNPEGFTLITDPAQIKVLYVKQYQTRILDGSSTVQNFTADLYIDTLNGIYTDAQVFELESHTKSLHDDLNNGWWLTAQNTNTNLPLLGIYNLLMKEELQLLIDTYILDNY
jgi:hypothetical protein